MSKKDELEDGFDEFDEFDDADDDELFERESQAEDFEERMSREMEDYLNEDDGDYYDDFGSLKDEFDGDLDE